MSQKSNELRLLKEEGEMTTEELRARYGASTDDKETCKLEKRGLDVGKREHGCSGETLNANTTVARRSGYKRPYLLTSRLDLREYQEAGVNWLLSMCERCINGILADEMGLGKTIQTISLLAHLACAQGLWGPHLIVVPTSCLVNWEMEFKRWCPAFKVLTYFGSAKRRKELRQGWSKQNAFQVCITSYQLVVQDAHCFKRKKWYYLILDEAHNIKNWKSLRWQTLLTFSSQRRLLLTGTPLQNNLLELWALMHFLMPHVFASRKEFSYWFQNPLALMVENGSDPTQSGENGVENGKDLVTQLHGIIRPFVLRRLKKDVAKQLPGKFEHVITCQLSRRQRFLYEDFISRSTTRRAMFGRGKGRGANFMSMMNVLMQLRKVCNHPDLFEPRPIASPLDMLSLHLRMPSRCGFLIDEIVNERPRIALWTGTNLPGLELLRYDKMSAIRRRQLMFYDVNVPLPADTITNDSPTFKTKTDIVRRLMALAVKRREYWAQKRTRISNLQKLQAGLFLDIPVFGDALIQACTMPTFISSAMEVHVHRARSFLDAREPTQALQAMVRDPEKRLASLQPMVNKSICYVPKARARPARVVYGGGGFAHDNLVLSRMAQAEELDVKYARPAASRILAPYYDSFKRTQLFFPDKALVQFDCGKLQQLAVLLRTLKRGNHRCLIFTQMSSMLNILEVFLNLHGHTYFRLDGATKVEKRQMLMERFNRDEKIFCFILSTRSGGLGINLTGADTVIFYDSDWNPAMDAQAQDRAHRIGQTRDVHIYRLVSEHTVEENILRKAQQKRHLDFLVMSEGQFTTDFFSKASLRELMTGGTGKEQEMESASESEDEIVDVDMEDENELSLDTVENAMAQLEDEEDVVAMKGARAEYLQELSEFDDDANSVGHVASPRPTVRTPHSVEMKPLTPSSVVSGSTAASEKEEDDDDELEEEIVGTSRHRLIERGSRHGFTTSDGSEDDESMDEGNGDDVKIESNRKRQRSVSNNQKRHSKRPKVLESHDQNGRVFDKVREKARDAAEEKKLQAWKASVQSLQGFEDSLNPVDRYALHFREDVEPLYAYTPAQQVAALAGVESDPTAPTLLQDIEQVEAEKREEEARLIAEGELVVGQMDDDDELSPEERAEQYTELYRRERAHVLFEGRKRLLTGAAWSLMKCANTGQPFYYNRDTREATWECPSVWTANEQLKSALQRGYEGLPPPALQRVLSMLTAYPERYRAQMVCRSWHTAAQHPSLFIKVSACDFEHGSAASLVQFLAKVAPGDTILFGAGVYQLDEPLKISKALRLLAASDAHVELQMRSCRAQVRWSARGGVMRGFHFTRTTSAPDARAREIKPSIDRDAATPVARKRRRVVRKQDKKLANWQHLLSVVGDGQLRVEYCEFDGNGLGNACVCVWGRGEKRKRRKRRRRDESSTCSTPSIQPPALIVDPSATAATPMATTTHTTASTPNVSSTLMGTSVTTETLTETQATATTPAATQSTNPVPIAVSASNAMLSKIPTKSSTITRILAPTLSDTTTPRATWSTTSLPQIVAASSTAAKVSAADTLLVLQNCRIRGAGSSGVLLVRGSLVLSLNTVEDNAHSGITVLGGNALVRRNKIQRNARFGLRLLYHAGNVIVEDNAMFGNTCGNLDVDNSGRRFVVRLNDMDKRKKTSETSSHSHGKLRLKTYRVLEKEAPIVSKPAPSVLSSTSEYWKRQFTGASPVTPHASLISPVSTMAAAITSRNPVVVANNMMGAGFPMGLMQSGAFAQGAHALHVSQLPMAFALVRAKPTIPSMTLNRPQTNGCAPGATSKTLQRSVTLPSTTTIKPTTTTVATSSTTLFVPPKKPHKRPRKMQQIVEGGREIILRDTCEKPIEKIVKPRRSKEVHTPVPTSTMLPQTPSSLAFNSKIHPGSTAAAATAEIKVVMATTGNSQALPSATTQAQKGVATTPGKPIATTFGTGPKPATPTTATHPIPSKSKVPVVATPKIEVEARATGVSVEAPGQQAQQSLATLTEVANESAKSNETQMLEAPPNQIIVKSSSDDGAGAL